MEDAGSMKVGNLHRAPATVALACVACGRLVTPCLVCGHIIPCCSSSSWQICHRCEVWNPTGEYERRLLGLPPPLALPSSMVRRVLVAHLGRRQYTLAIHMELLKLQQMRETSRTVVQEQELSTSFNYNVSGDKDQCGMHFRSVNLPFVLYEGITESLVQKRDGQLHCGYFETCIVTQCSQRTSLTRTCSSKAHSKAECHLSTDSAKQGRLNMNYNGSPSAERERLEPDFPDRNKLNEDVYTDRCDACDGDCQASCRTMLQTGKVGLWWLQDQLVKMHCPETLSRDLHSSFSQYPICSFRTKSVVKTLRNRCGNARVGGCCASKVFDSLSLSLLQLSSSYLTLQLEDWLAEKKIHGGASQYVVDILSTADLFIQNKAKILESQNAVSRACIARKQAIQDCTALSQKQLCRSANQGSLLQNALVKSIQERTEKWKKDVEPFLILLNQINLFLEFCCLQACNIRTPHCSISLPQTSGKEEINQEDTLIEAMNMVVSSFLLLYHDIAHVVNII